MAELKKRKFTARDAYNLMMRESAAAREDYEAARIAETIYSLTAGADYQGSGAQSKNKSYVNSIGKGLSSGSSSRYKMLQDADKEELSQMFTEEFNKALPGFTSIMDFNKWATTMGDWYQEDLRAKHSTIVRNALTGRKQKTLSDKSSEFLDENLPLWLSNDYTQQQLFREMLAEDIKGDDYGTLWGAEVMDQASKILSPQGQYTESAEARSVASEDRNVLAGRRLQEADWDATTENQFLIQAIDEIEGTVGGVPFADREPRSVEDVRREYAAMLARAGIDSTNFMQSLDEAYGTRAQEIARDKAPGTKKAYDASTGETIFATDAEIAANDNLVPEESNLEKDYAQVGREMVANGEMPVEVWETYRMGGMDKLDRSISGADKDIILLWINEVKKRRAKASAGVNINYQMLNPDASGQAIGQKDDGITDVRIKK